jgi:hypothetical protein
MAVTLNLPPAIEQQLKAKAERFGLTLEQYLLHLAVCDAASEPVLSPPEITYPPGFATPEEWTKALREWAESHPRVEHFVDDSRESIYAGRGE